MNAKEAVLEALAENTIFSYDDLELALSVWHSYDILINACDLAMTSGMTLKRACMACSVVGTPVMLDPSIPKDEIRIIQHRFKK